MPWLYNGGHGLMECTLSLSGEIAKVYTSNGQQAPWLYWHSGFHRICPWAIRDRKCNTFFILKHPVEHIISFYSKYAIFYCVS